MTKRFFIVFFMYFFVVQSAIFGIVRAEPKFFAIGLVNLVFIVLMALFYTNFESSRTDKSQESGHNELKTEQIIGKYRSVLGSYRRTEKTWISYLFVISIILLFLAVLGRSFLHILPISIWRFAGFYFIMLFLSAKKMLEKKIFIGNIIFLPKDFLFWTSLILVIGVYGTLPLQVVSFKILFSLLIGFIFFFIGAGIIKDSGSSNIFKISFIRLYMILLGILFIITAIQSFSYDYSNRLAADWNQMKNLVKNWSWQSSNNNLQDDFTGKDILSNGTGQILSNSLIDSGSVLIGEEIGSGDVFVESGEIFTDVLPVNSNVSIGTSDMEVITGNAIDDERLKIATYPTLMDVLIYLMDHYDVELSIKKDINFTYVSTQNPYYAQFRTAYENKLIGRDSNPSKRVLCETYIVMKGLLQGWDVDTSNIKANYREEAVSRNQLNGCKWNFYVRNINL